MSPAVIGLPSGGLGIIFDQALAQIILCHQDSFRLTVAEDYLASCSVAQVACWYRRLADAWSRNMPELQPPLAGTFLRAWVDNRNRREFQLKSKVVVLAKRGTGNQATVQFQSWACSATDRYDWDHCEHLTVANPDYQSKEPDAIRLEDRTLTVFQRNAKRLEDAGLAAPYDVVVRPRMVTDQRVAGPAAIDIARRL
jgi:hypothetical protein